MSFVALWYPYPLTSLAWPALAELAKTDYPLTGKVNILGQFITEYYTVTNLYYARSIVHGVYDMT